MTAVGEELRSGSNVRKAKEQLLPAANSSLNVNIASASEVAAVIQIVHVQRG